MQGVKITQVELNIGLNNNPYKDEYEIREILKREGFTLFNTTPSFIAGGEWKGFDEPTFVIAVSSTLSEDAIHARVEGLTKLFSQQAIAVLLNNNKGKLVYHPHYNKKKLTFDKEYFIDAYNKNYGKNFKA